MNRWYENEIWSVLTKSRYLVLMVILCGYFGGHSHTKKFMDLLYDLMFFDIIYDIIKFDMAGIAFVL